MIVLFAVLSLVLSPAGAGGVQNPKTAEVTVDFTNTTAISPYIYGANFPEWEAMKTPFSVTRQGGNRTTAYNWENNASNAGNDYRNQNDGYMGASNEPGWTQRTFLESGQAHQAAVILTIPCAGYVSADKAPDNDVNLTPNYLNVRFHRSLARKPGGKFAYPPDTKDRFVYQDECVSWLQGINANKTPLWFSLDNEPDLWPGTHSRIVPKQLTYAEMIANNVSFADAIKAVAPKSLVFGPASYGWQGFRRLQDAPDAADREFLDVYLAGMKQAEAKAGRRLLDVLDLHWYPEARGDGIRICDNTPDKPGTKVARIQAPRSLWDPSYVETSWIADSLGGKPITLLPRVNDQIAKNYPGTKLAFTEYNYGGGKDASGLVAQADVLGLFGRYGVFAACNWGISPNDPAQISGFRAFLDFDGKGSKFGDLGAKVSGESAATNSVYAALDSKNKQRMTVLVINKSDSPQPFRIRLRGFRAMKGQGFEAQYDRPFSPKPVTVGARDDSLTYAAGPRSVTTIVVSSVR